AKQRLTDLLLDFGANFLVILQELLGVLAALAKPFAIVREPCTALLNNVLLGADIDDAAFLGNAFAIHNIDIRLLKRRRDFVLYNLDLRAVADDVVALFDRLHAANVKTNAGVEFEGASARRRLRIAEHDANLLTQLVNEDRDRFRLADRSG